MSRATVGKISQELLQKNEGPINIIDQGREMRKDYVTNLQQSIERYKDRWHNQDFYIVVIQKTERLMTNVLRNFFFGRLSCPTPDYDQTLFKFNSKTQELEFIWAIPSKDACIYLLNNKNYVQESEHELLQFVLDFKDGKLFALAKKLNKEVDLETPIIDKR